ncbi:MAG: hypothetical protein LUG91_10385 [Ruminococcus sp.]|nr:hypothetical protein [Ruminococcus sp.]MCD7812225.1 hypothetical protein [Ruminococcus sp.]
MMKNDNNNNAEEISLNLCRYYTYSCSAIRTTEELQGAGVRRKGVIMSNQNNQNNQNQQNSQNQQNNQNNQNQQSKQNQQQNKNSQSNSRNQQNQNNSSF